MKIGLIIVDGGLRRRISHKQNLQLRSEGALCITGGPVQARHPSTGSPGKLRVLYFRCHHLASTNFEDLRMLMKREFLTNKICNCSLKELCITGGPVQARHPSTGSPGKLRPLYFRCHHLASTNFEDLRMLMKSK
ncbi:succinate dehydrogenase assembly factor 1, mitochondrial isoform X2 [Ambystoma mexicanum]|uniref:succinate dehydrogenase assembly factor 1, mitochondrial isoform X2 n=1 Tax=Ambystoma mexicanum TaxID=8296 RepID=UPI0037E81F7F